MCEIDSIFMEDWVTRYNPYFINKFKMHILCFMVTLFKNHSDFISQHKLN